jgi:hypothetical protein
MTKEDALILMLQEWEAANDLDPIEDEPISVIDEPKRNHLVKKVRDRTIQEVANLIRKFQLDDPRSKEILHRAEALQRKAYRKPRKNRKRGRPTDDHRIFDTYVLESDTEEVREPRYVVTPIIKQEIPGTSGNTPYVAMPLI